MPDTEVRSQKSPQGNQRFPAGQAEIRILLTGGGSGGHIYPLLAVVHALKSIGIERGFKPHFYYFGSAHGYAHIINEAGISIMPILSGKLRRYFSIQNFFDIPKFFISLFQAFVKIFIVMPDAIFSKGGPGSLSVILAGWFYRIPIMIHESDVFPGLTNAISSKFAKRIAVSFKETMKYFNPQKVFWSGSPVRKELLKTSISSKEAKKELGFEHSEPLVLIIGGSQGSSRINEFVLANLQELTFEFQILHQVGEKNYDTFKKILDSEIKRITLKRKYEAVPYLQENLGAAYQAADIVMSRASSGVIFEIASFGKPSILVPLSESANDHQRKNAYEFAKNGAAIVIEEKNLVPGIVTNQIRNIIHDETALEKAKVAALRIFKPGAAEEIAEEIVKIIRESR